MTWRIAFRCPEGARTNQPRATPWEHAEKECKPCKGVTTASPVFVPPLQGLVGMSAVSQGVALGWFVWAFQAENWRPPTWRFSHRDSRTPAGPIFLLPHRGSLDYKGYSPFTFRWSISFSRRRRSCPTSRCFRSIRATSKSNLGATGGDDVAAVSMPSCSRTLVGTAARSCSCVRRRRHLAWRPPGPARLVPTAGKDHSLREPG